MNKDEQRAFDDFIQWHRENTVRQMEDSAFVTSLVPSGETDVKFALELGLSIMLDKPILAICAPGQTVPPKLALVADEIIEADVDVDEDREKVALAIKDFMAAHVKDGDTA